MACEYAEILFNPVERMMVVRPCTKDNPNAIPWTADSLSARSLVRIFYDSMGWDNSYTYRVPCQTVRQPHGDAVVLVAAHAEDRLFPAAAQCKGGQQAESKQNCHFLFHGILLFPYVPLAADYTTAGMLPQAGLRKRKNFILLSIG